jgi:uracil phosphoribosyltransferase
MNITYLDTYKYPQADTFINICKSDSGETGFVLRHAHYQLGKMLATIIMENMEETTITLIVMMRSGLCLGLGIADAMETSGRKVSLLLYNDTTQWEKERKNCSRALTNKILLIDSVINTGLNIITFADSLRSKDIIFVTNVIAEKALPLFENRKLFIVRVSQRSFVGAKVAIPCKNKGPDTGDRLFNTK